MKRFLLGLVFVAGLCLNVDAANPSFSSFATNHFITNNFLIRSRLNPLQFDTNASTITITNAGGGGTTNYFNTIYVTNLYATNFYAYTTNLYTTNITAEHITVITNITVGGTNLATINPTDGKYPYRSGTNSFGDGAITHIDANTAGVDEMDIGTLVVTNLMTGGVVISDTSGILTNVPVGTGALLNDGANNFSWGAVGTINPTDGYIPFRTNATTFLNSPFYVVSTNVATDSQIIFGPGMTNALKRESKTLVYEVTSTEPAFIVRDLNGEQLSLGLNPSGDASLAADTSQTLSLLTSAYGVMLFGNAFVPTQDDTVNLGSTNTSSWWHELALKGSSTISGYESGTNYSRLAISHTGTNGAVVLDSQANGTAGSPRPIDFAWNGTNVSQIKVSGDRHGLYVYDHSGVSKISAGYDNAVQQHIFADADLTVSVGYAGVFKHAVQSGEEGFWNGSNAIQWVTGNGSPEGAVAAPVGSLYSRKDGGVGTTLYVKESGTGTTGWAPK